MTEAMPFLQKTILLSYDPRPSVRECFKRSYAARFGVSRPRIKRMCIRFSLTLYLLGKIAFSRQQRLIYFQYPLHRFFDQSHTSVSPLSSGGFNTSPIRLRFFLSSVFAAQSAAPSPILSDNQKSAEHPLQDTGSICRGR